jgi:hypothetical protein
MRKSAGAADHALDFAHHAAADDERVENRVAFDALKQSRRERKLFGDGRERRLRRNARISMFT